MILITGGSGFIGKVLKTKLETENRKIVEINSEHGGVTNPDLLNALPQSIEYVFHLAGRTYVPESWTSPTGFFEVNTQGTQHVLEFCRRRHIGLTFISSYLYGPPQTLPIAETHPVCPNNPYAQSKYLAEELCAFYAREFEVDVKVIRPFNAYGMDQDERFLIPTIVEQALSPGPIKLKDLSPKRDYIHVADLVEALVCSFQAKTDRFSVYNVGSGESFSVQEVVAMVLDILGSSKDVVSENEVRKNELNNVVADISKARKELNWQPSYSLRSGLEQIIARKCES